MKNKNLLIIGAVIIAAIFFLKKKKSASTLPIEPTSPIQPVLNDNKPILPIETEKRYPRDMLADYNPNNFTDPILPIKSDQLYARDMLPNSNYNIYPGGLSEGMRVMADNDPTQLILENGKKWELTNEQLQMRGYDFYVTVNSNILNQIPFGGIYNSF
jgi:hypothetical protein